MTNNPSPGAPSGSLAAAEGHQQGLGIERLARHDYHRQDGQNIRRHQEELIGYIDIVTMADLNKKQTTALLNLEDVIDNMFQDIT